MITPQVLMIFGSPLISLIEGVISLRILLKLLGASPGAPFVRWIYDTSKPLLYPFEGMFPSSNLNGIPFTIEFSALFALFAYIFVGYIFQEMLYYADKLNNRKEQNIKKHSKDKE